MIDCIRQYSLDEKEKQSYRAVSTSDDTGDSRIEEDEMKFLIAFLICSAGTSVLFYLDRDNSSRHAKALWLPVIWLWIAGSRPVSSWFNMGGPEGQLASTLDGSPLDAAVFLVLLVLGLIVLFSRRKKTKAFLSANSTIIVFFVYCLISVAWSPFHGPAFKRWIKAIGDLIMVLVLVTDGDLVANLRRLYSRLGFILLPFSIILIRYTDLGRGYDPDGLPMNTGVTTNKNSLGLIVFLISLGALWNVRTLLREKRDPTRTRRLIAQTTLLGFGILMLHMARSATSIACFILGGVLMFATNLRMFRNRPGRVRALAIGVVVAGALTMYLGGQSAVASALGRSSTLSGRTDIWEASIASADNPLIGTGFESFWNVNAHKVSRILVARGFIDMSNLVSAHNGYIEVYLDLGYVGVGLLALVLVKGFRDAVNSFRYDPRLAGLLLAYVTTATFYAITEAGFRMLSPSWIFLLLAAVTASGLSRGVLRGKKPGVLVAQAEKIPATLDDRQILRHQPSENAPMQVKTDRTAAQANSK